MAGEKIKSLRDEYKNATPISTERAMEKWDKLGKTLRGRFVRVKDGSLRNQRILVLADEHGEPFQVSCPTTLEDWVSGIKPGTELVIRYMRDEAKGEGKNPMKIFEVVALN